MHFIIIFFDIKYKGNFFGVPLLNENCKLIKTVQNMYLLYYIYFLGTLGKLTPILLNQ